MPEATQWIVSLLTGSVATTVAILAVAVVGLSFLAGRMHYGQVLRVVLGCFIIFGAGAIATGLVALGGGSAERAPGAASAVEPPAFMPPEAIEGAYRPYPGAALPDQPSTEEGWIEE